MATNILNIGRSALAAAQVGISTTGHSIANAATPGYSRQVVVQGTAQPQSFGFGFMGQGAEIDTVKRVYSEFLGSQVRSAQTSKSGLDSYYAQIKQIDNLLADPAAGLSPALQGFFSGIQEMSSNPALIPSRQAALSSAETLVSRFQSLAGRLDEIEQGINSQITSSVNGINTYAQQIAQLNDAIGRAQSGSGQPANDLLDQRDQLVLDLNREIKATVVKQDNGHYNISIGNGQPLVVGVNTYALSTAASPANPERIEVAYRTAGKTVVVGESSLVGGKLGGLVEFRNQTLDSAQNALGRVAIGMASTFNAQHRLGRDLNGNPGGDFFTLPPPVVGANSANAGDAKISASIGNVNALTTSDYRLQYDGTDYTLTRLSDNKKFPPGALPQTVDGIEFSLDSGSADAGDSFLIRPTVNGASGLAVALTDPAQIAAAAALPVTPVGTSAASANAGDVAIGGATVDSSYTAPLAAPVTFTYKVDPVNGDGFVLSTPVTVTDAGAPPTTTAYAAGDIVPYVEGATISFGGISFVLSSPTGTAPADGDSFTVAANPFRIGDNRNALLLGALQTANTLGGGTVSFQGAYSQLVSQIGNKTHELEVTSSAAGKLLSEAQLSLQTESGVNLDEEATNLLRYQQAYQAAAKVMQIASEMFDALLSIGR